MEEEKKEVDEAPSSTFPSVALFSPLLVAENMVKIWEKHLASAPYLTQKRREKLTSVLDVHFHGDLAKWDLFCQQLTLSPFLRGEGPRGWRVSLDWILLEENLIKVLEGNFDDPHRLQLEETQKVSATHHRNISNILASIEDPVWRECCDQFSEGIRLNETRYLVEPLRPFDLEKIANARFLEFEDEKLFWVGSTDASVLKKIKDLRLTLSSYFTRKYPKFRMIRTRLIESSLESQETLVTQTKSSLSSEVPLSEAPLDETSSDGASLGETLLSETPSGEALSNGTLLSGILSNASFTDKTPANETLTSETPLGSQFPSQLYQPPQSPLCKIEDRSGQPAAMALANNSPSTERTQHA